MRHPALALLTRAPPPPVLLSRTARTACTACTAENLKYKFMVAYDRAIMHLDKAFGFVAAPHSWVSRKDEGDKIIVLERGGCWVPVPAPPRCVCVLWLVCVCESVCVL